MFVSLAVNSEDTLYSCARLMHYLPIRTGAWARCDKVELDFRVDRSTFVHGHSSLVSAGFGCNLKLSINHHQRLATLS